jgi:hypothetical protein
MPLPVRTSHVFRTRALIVAGAGGLIVAIVACAAVIVPLGRARHWRPAGGDPPADLPKASTSA